jgi:hypothetical protein
VLLITSAIRNRIMDQVCSFFLVVAAAHHGMTKKKDVDLLVGLDGF